MWERKKIWKAKVSIISSTRMRVKSKKWNIPVIAEHAMCIYIWKCVFLGKFIVHCVIYSNRCLFHLIPRSLMWNIIEILFFSVVSYFLLPNLIFLYQSFWRWFLFRFVIRLDRYIGWTRIILGIWIPCDFQMAAK